LTTFPHLIRHVRRLSISPIDIFGSNITQKTLEKICNIPFAHLESVFMFIRKRLDYRPAIQQLFSLSTVVHLKLDIFLGDVSFFVDVWKCYSRGLRHLKLVVWLDLADDYETYDADPLTCGMPIQLDSLRDAFTYDNSGPDSQDLYTWVLHPFGLSHLKPLAICDEMGVSWEKFGKLFKFFDVFAPVCTCFHLCCWLAFTTTTDFSQGTGNRTRSLLAPKSLRLSHNAGRVDFPSQRSPLSPRPLTFA
jgi:hypothetical protein